MEKDFLNIDKTIQSWTLGKKVETSLMNSNAKDFSIQLDLGGDLGSSRPGFYGWYKNEMCEDKKISFNLRNKYCVDNAYLIYILISLFRIPC